MNEAIFNPVEEFESKYKNLHQQNVNQYFGRLVQQSGVNIEQNRETVRLYEEYKESVAKLTKKRNWWRFLRVLMCLTIILIPLVIIKVTPIIRNLLAEIQTADQKVAELFAEAQRQMLPLNQLFTDRDSLNLLETTLPLLSFADCFTADQEADMTINYNYTGNGDLEQSTIEVLAGRYNENPFLFENRLIHRMGTETYHGYLTIHWTETYRDSNGHLQTRHKTQTLHATVVKPKPFYSTQAILNYCAQGGPELSFSREATYLHQKSDKEIERYVKHGEKKLKKMTDKAIKGGGDFMSMSNSQFEVLFNALDRDHEVQYRSLFTPLAQTNMVAMIRSKVGFGDDFTFIKNCRSNKIITHHSQGRVLRLRVGHYVSHSFDVIQSNFINKNMDFFKAVYFDFAPLWAIPMYQDRPVHSLQPIPPMAQKFSVQECESLVNVLDASHVVHPDTKTQAILKAYHTGTRPLGDEITVMAYSYDVIRRVDLVPMRGGDGNIHAVPVEWDEYIPLQATSNFVVSNRESTPEQSIIASRNGLCVTNY